MISDTLSDALAEIADYRDAFPGVYAAHADMLDAVVAVMDSARAALDDPQFDPRLETEAWRARWRTIGRIGCFSSCLCLSCSERTVRDQHGRN